MKKSVKPKAKVKAKPKLSASARKRQRENKVESVKFRDRIMHAKPKLISPDLLDDLDPITEKSIKDMIAQMNVDAKLGTERERARLDKLNQEGVGEQEMYAYVTFPAPIKDYLDYIKSTKGNLESWGSLASFMKYTDMFWKMMRDQSLKMALDAAKSLAYSDGCLADKSYFLEIAGLYINRLEKEISNNESSNELKMLLDLILEYNGHVLNVEQTRYE